MPGCSVKSCKNWNGNTKNKNIKYFSFPKDENLLKIWLDVCIPNVNLKNGRVCSVHFSPDSFQDTSHLYIPGKPPVLKLQKNAVPTLCLECVEQKQRKRGRQALGGNSCSDKESCAKVVKFDKAEQNEHKTNLILPHDQEKISTSVSQQLSQVNANNCTDEPILSECVNNRMKAQEQVSQLERKIVVQPVPPDHNYIQEQKSITLSEQDLENLINEKVKKKMHDVLSLVFTECQIRKILNPYKSKIKWSPEDIANAISLRSVSPKAYRFLKNKNFPLPALSTLRSWASQIEIKEGIIESVMTLMQAKAKSMADHEKICCLCFDEIHTSQDIEIDKKMEKKIGPHKAIQVGMVRGLFSKWKQPVYFAYDDPLTEETVLLVIGKLFDAGYTVVSLTTDMGPTNSHIFKHEFIVHPRDSSLKVFIFADVPHLLKSIRNNFIDHGFYIQDKYVTKDCLERLIRVNQGDLKIAHKLEQKHLDVKGAERQKVSFATRIFSNTTAEAVRFCGFNGYLDFGSDKCEDFEDCANFLKLVNDWFDIMNSSSKYGTKDAYGLDLVNQNHILDQITELMNSMRVGGRKSLSPFQKGIILSNLSLQKFLPYLQEKYDRSFKISYILTRRFNQDVLENFFSYIRAMGALHDKPTALQFQYRLRWYILGKHSADMLTDKTNTEDDDDETLVDIKDRTLCDNTEIRAMQGVMGSLYDDEINICEPLHKEVSQNNCDKEVSGTY